jgi:hypothetical protein
MDVPNILIFMCVPFSVFCVLFVYKYVLLPPGVNLIAVKYISYHIISYIMSYHIIRVSFEGSEE